MLEAQERQSIFLKLLVLRSDRTERKEEIEIGNLRERQIEKELVSVNISEGLLNI
jgi:hypothetical protein